MRNSGFSTRKRKKREIKEIGKSNLNEEVPNSDDRTRLRKAFVGPRNQRIRSSLLVEVIKQVGTNDSSGQRKEAKVGIVVALFVQP
jgi:hypothetical protein